LQVFFAHLFFYPFLLSAVLPFVPFALQF
jgi:hypothetical protein